MSTYSPGYECLACKSDLYGRQQYWCSERCRSTFRAGTHLRVRECRFCGEKLDESNFGKECRMGSPRLPDDPRYSERDERRDDIADTNLGEHCYEMQAAAEEKELDRLDARDAPICAYCGEEGEYACIGRHRKYCQDRCRVYAYRARKRGVPTPRERNPQ